MLAALDLYLAEVSANFVLEQLQRGPFAVLRAAIKALEPPQWGCLPESDS